MRLITTLFSAAALVCAADPANVDVAWKVLPRRVVADSFGARVAKLYFTVVAVVGNNSGHDLQVSSILFQLPASTGIAAPIPVDPHRVVRGSLEREHLVGARNSTIGVIKALGPVLTGGTAFFSGATFARAVDIFSNPFEKGFELAFPDKTVSQLAALDNLAMRDQTIVTSNTQQVLIAFVSRDLLVNDSNRRQLRHGIRGEFDPLAVMRALGDLVLEGKSISYVNRVTVTVHPPPQ